MKIPEASHPLWSIIKLLVLFALLKCNSTNFDLGEVLTLAGFAGAEGGFDLIHRRRGS